MVFKLSENVIASPHYIAKREDVGPFGIFGQSWSLYYLEDFTDAGFTPEPLFSLKLEEDVMALIGALDAAIVEKEDAAEEEAYAMREEAARFAKNLLCTVAEAEAVTKPAKKK